MDTIIDLIYVAIMWGIFLSLLMFALSIVYAIIVAIGVGIYAAVKALFK